MHDAVASLPPDLQVVIALYHLEALSFAEIAGRLGLPATTIKGRLNRGRELLRKEMLRMGMGTDSDKITFAPTRVGLLLAPATPYGATGEDAPSLGRLLTSAGFATSAVPPERAVASLRRTIPQILVVADDVPGVDAFALIRDLRSEHRTRGIALVPLKGLPQKGVNTLSALTKLVTEPKEKVFLGILVGTPNMKIRLVAPGAPMDGSPPPSQPDAVPVPPVEVSLGAEEFYYADPPNKPRQWGTHYPIGAMLVLREGKVDVLTADPDGQRLLGHLAATVAYGKLEEPSASNDNGTVTLSVSLPLLDDKGNRTGAQAFRVTVVVPLIE